MKISAALVLSLLIHFCCYSQSKKDSIDQFLDTASTISVIDFYYEHGRDLEKNDPDSAQKAYHKGLKLSYQIKDRNSIKDGWIELGYFHKFSYSDSSPYYFEKALVLADSFRFIHDQQRIRAQLAYFYIKKQNHLVALKWALGELEYSYIKGDSLTIADNYAQLAEINDNLGNQQIALKYYLDAYRIYNTHNDVDYATSTMANIGTLYKKSGNYDQALVYYQKSIDYYLGQDQLWKATSSLNNKALTYKAMGQWQKADSLMQIVLSESEKNGDEYSLFSAYHNMGAVHLAKGEFCTALSFFNKSQLLIDRLDFRLGHSKNSLYIAKTYFETNQLAKAKEYALISLNNAEVNQFLDEQIEATEFLISVYKRMDDFQKAFILLEEVNQMKASKEENLKEAMLYQLEITNKLKEKDNELKTLNQQNEIARLESENQKEIRNYLIVGLIFSGVVLSILVLFYKRNIKLAGHLRHKNEQVLEQAKLLEEANELKGKFFANISHELRTPLTLIKGMIQTLIEDKKDESSHQRLDIARRNTDQLESMINELLELSRMEVKTIEVNLKSHYARPLIDRIATSFSSLAYQKGLSLQFESSIPEDVVIDIDERKLEKILNNLLFNAIKFSNEEETVTVSLLFDEDKLQILVNNVGEPIQKNHLPNIFDRFYQTSKDHASEGLGLGLAIVKELTLLMSGTIDVTSNADSGTTFYLSFPAKQKELPIEEELVLASIDLTTFGKPKILIVEDHEEMRTYIGDILKSNFKIESAQNGVIALEKLEKNKYDLVITDLMMPEMDGFELVEKLKSSARYKQLPLVVLTARGADVDRLSLLNMGIDDYITKPFNPDELKVRLYNIFENLKERVKWTEVVDNQPTQEPETVKNDLISRLESFIRARLGGAPMAVSDLARHVAMSERQLYRKLGELTGLTPANLIKEVKLKFAMQLAQERKYNKVESIAKEVGFDSVAYFSKQFYQRFGKRPTEYLI